MYFFFSFLKFIYLNDLYTQCGFNSEPQDQESYMLFLLSQPGVLPHGVLIFTYSFFCCLQKKYLRLHWGGEEAIVQGYVMGVVISIFYLFGIY